MNYVDVQKSGNGLGQAVDGNAVGSIADRLGDMSLGTKGLDGAAVVTPLPIADAPSATAGF